MAVLSGFDVEGKVKDALSQLITTPTYLDQTGGDTLTAPVPHHGKLLLLTDGQS